MGSAGIKDNVKTLFLIFNTLTALLPGLLCVPIGLLIAYATGLQYGVDDVGICVAVGLIALGIAALGYVGAIKDKKIKLYIYSGLMVLAVIGDIVGFAIVHRREVVLKVITGVHLGGVLVTVALAVILACLPPRSGHQGSVLSPAPTPYTPDI